MTRRTKTAPDMRRPPPGGRAGVVFPADSGGRSRTGLARSRTIRDFHGVPESLLRQTHAPQRTPNGGHLCSGLWKTTCRAQPEEVVEELEVLGDDQRTGTTRLVRPARRGGTRGSPRRGPPRDPRRAPGPGSPCSLHGTRPSRDSCRRELRDRNHRGAVQEILEISPKNYG